MSTPAITPDDIEGLPPGAVLKPIQGLPPGAILKPINRQAASATPATPADSTVGTPYEGYARLGHGVLDALKGFVQMPGQIAHAFGDAPTQKEYTDNPLLGPAELAFKRLVLDPMAAERAKATPDLEQGHTSEAIAHSVAGSIPVAGPFAAHAGEAIGTDPLRGSAELGTNLLAPVGAAKVGGTMMGKLHAPLPPAAEVLPKHVEALTGLIEDRGGTIDPHVTAIESLPHLRETAVRMKIDPSKLEGREAGQATLKVAEQAVRDTQGEFNEIRKPYNSVLVDQKPIAQAYRDAITPELLANEPKVARALESQAKKFDQPAPLEQVNQFRVRMNRQLDALEKRGTTAQIMSSDMERANRAATNASRDVEYSTVGRLSGLDPEYIRSLKQREGSLIEAKNSLEKEYNRASGQQGEAVSKTLREKATSTFPSKHGVEKSVVKNLLGPKPIEILNSRIQNMFADMGMARELPEYELQPPEAPVETGGPTGPVPSGEAPRGIKPLQQRTFLRTTQADVKDYYNYRFDQLREEMKSATTPDAKADVQRRMTELDQTQRSHPTSEGGTGVKPPVAPVAAGKITPEHVAAENAFYTQARAELGANADASAVLQRAQALKVEHAAKGAPPPVTPANPPKPPTLTQKMAANPPKLRRVTPPVAPSSASGGTSSLATPAAIMLAAKRGDITPAEADRRIKQLTGGGGNRTIRRPVAPE